MELIADILLVAGALGAGMYCFVLSRRLKRFTDLEKGVGGAVSVLSSQADELRKSLDSARQASDESGAALQALTERAETVAQRLELMMASMHDVVQEDPPESDAQSDVPDGQSVEDSAEQPGDAQETAAAPPDEPAKAPDEPAKASNAPANAPDIPAAEQPETAPEPPAKKPEGLMFFRHAAASGGAAK